MLIPCELNGRKQKAEGGEGVDRRIREEYMHYQQRVYYGLATRFHSKEFWNTLVNRIQLQENRSPTT